ncbi:MAG: hypothetical protein EOP08_15970 [Proteobacteria bacterium]|nr:MAG: hypothetical protein EOP08_15970 [Pseudomonadota bacterium]
MTWATFITLGLLACGGDEEPGPTGAAGAVGQTGATGPEGPASSSSGAVGIPSISGISPAEIFLGYPTVLTISGSGTHWTEAPAVTFEGEGGGVVVDSVELASPTALVVTAHAERTATVGPRTVRVGNESFAGFTVSPDLSLEPIGDEPLRAGGVAFAQLTGRNPLNPFLPSYATALTPTFSQNGVVALPGETVSLAPGSPSVLATLIVVALHADVAASGSYDFDFLGPDTNSVIPRSRFSGSKLVNVAAAEPIAVAQFPALVSFTGATKLGAA